MDNILQKVKGAYIANAHGRFGGDHALDNAPECGFVISLIASHYKSKDYIQ